MTQKRSAWMRTRANMRSTFFFIIFTGCVKISGQGIMKENKITVHSSHKRRLRERSGQQ